MPDLSTHFVIADASNGLWQVAVDDSGAISLASTAGPTPPALYLNDNSNFLQNNLWNVYLILQVNPANSWLLQAATDGSKINATSVLFGGGYPVISPNVRSPSGTYWYVQVTPAGAVVTQRDWFNSPNPASFGDQSVGELRPHWNSVTQDAVLPGTPLPVQPSGPGTPVSDPSQYPQQRTGWFSCGAGTTFMNWEVQWASINGVPKLLVTDPMTGYIQSVYDPQQINGETGYSNPATQIIVG